MKRHSRDSDTVELFQSKGCSSQIMSGTISFPANTVWSGNPTRSRWILAGRGQKIHNFLGMTRAQNHWFKPVRCHNGHHLFPPRSRARLPRLRATRQQRPTFGSWWSFDLEKCLTSALGRRTQLSCCSSLRARCLYQRGGTQRLILSRVKLASGNGSGGEGEAVFIQRALRDLLASLSTWSPLGY